MSSEYEQCMLAIETEDPVALFKVLRTSINDLNSISTPKHRTALIWLALIADDARIRNIALHTRLGKDLLEIFPIFNTYNYLE